MRMLLTGGSACGKSSFAEQVLLQLPRPYYYIATMQPYGADGAAKVDKHRAMRADKGMVTIERYHDLADLQLPQRGTVLFEDIPNLLANEMFDDAGVMHDPTDPLAKGIAALVAQADNILIVTNEVGSGLYSYESTTQAYVRMLGAINQYAAGLCDYAYEFVCGIPLQLKAPQASSEEQAVGLAHATTKPLPLEPRS